MALTARIVLGTCLVRLVCSNPSFGSNDLDEMLYMCVVRLEACTQSAGKSISASVYSVATSVADEIQIFARMASSLSQDVSTAAPASIQKVWPLLVHIASHQLDSTVSCVLFSYIQTELMLMLSVSNRMSHFRTL